MGSILTSIKSLLGIQEDYTHFDDDIIMHINTVFFTLSQIGVNPTVSFSIKDATEVWTDFTLTNLNLEIIKTYIYLKVKLLFDPPLSSAVINVIQTQISELEFRIMVDNDPILSPIPVPVIDDEVFGTW